MHESWWNMNFEQFMNVLDIKEEYQIQPKLMEVLLSDRKNVLLDQLIANGFDTSKDELREIFENELANRKKLAFMMLLILKEVRKTKNMMKDVC